MSYVCVARSICLLCLMIRMTICRFLNSYLIAPVILQLKQSIEKLVSVSISPEITKLNGFSIRELSLGLNCWEEKQHLTYFIFWLTSLTALLMEQQKKKTRRTRVATALELAYKSNATIKSTWDPLREINWQTLEGNPTELHFSTIYCLE